MWDIDEWNKYVIAKSERITTDGKEITAEQIKTVMSDWQEYAFDEFTIEKIKELSDKYITTMDDSNVIVNTSVASNIPRINNWEKFKTFINYASTGYGIAFYEQYHSSPSHYSYKLIADNKRGNKYEIVITWKDCWKAMDFNSADVIAIPNDKMMQPGLLWTYLKDSFKIP